MSSNEPRLLNPPRPKERTGSSSSGSSDGPRPPFAAVSRPTSPRSVSYADSPPVTPRALTFNAPVNPFSSPGDSSKHSLSPPPTPTHRPHTSSASSSSAYPFPDSVSRSGATSRTTSAGDIPRLRNGSRPATSGTHSPSASFHRLRESFTSPPTRPVTMYSTVARFSARVQKERLKSTMLTEDAVVDKPWLKERDVSARVAYFLTYFFIFIGAAVGGIKCFFSWHNVQLQDPSTLCLVMEENFNSYDEVFGQGGTFFREVDMSGFGNGEFEMTTNSQNNSYVSNGMLYITPTLTSDSIGINAIEDGYVYNITGCTYNTTHSYTQLSQSPASSNSQSNTFDSAAYYRACSAVSNVTAGTVINPVQTARLTTRQSASIKYGRVEARAKLPKGDWLWPSIWMLPVNNTYGPWPMSGEIDIMESRGNAPQYPYQGANYVRGTLNWGPTSWLNAGYRTFGWWFMKRGTYADDFHTFSLEWDKSFIRIYVDNRLHNIFSTDFSTSFWNRGQFPVVIQDGGEAVVINNPWANATNAAPFDQPFYLILSLGVGGTNGWFPDDNAKPWLDNSRTPMLDFWRAKDQWLSTWSKEDKSFVIDYVKMWKKC